MSPRPYQLGKRREQIDEARQRVIDAARRLLGEAGSYTAFTVDAVANRADVARATVYYQFESKTGLLEAVFDSLAAEGRLFELEKAFMAADPIQAIRQFVECFGRFWAVDRLAMRRLRALAALDPEVGSSVRKRDQRRRAGLEVLVGRIVAEGRPGKPANSEQLIRILHTLTGFETFDTLAPARQKLTAVSGQVIDLVEAAVARYRAP